MLYAPFTNAACMLIGRLRGFLVVDQLASRTLTAVGCRIGDR